MRKILFIPTILFFAMIFAGAASAQDKIYKMNEVDKKPEITESPQVRADANCGNVKGLTVRLRVVLHKSGKVSDVEILDASKCETFNQRAVEAAKAIKFKPAEKGGKAVSVAVTITHNFEGK